MRQGRLDYDSVFKNGFNEPWENQNPGGSAPYYTAVLAPRRLGVGAIRLGG